MKDFLGQEIKIGDIVAHGQRSGNSGVISIKIVKELRTVDKWNSKIDEVKVVGYAYLEHKWDKETREWTKVEPYYQLKQGGWTYPSVLIVINDSVPKEIKEFLQS